MGGAKTAEGALWGDHPLRALYIYISVSERVRVKHDGDDDTLTFDNGSVNLGLLESLWFRKGRPQ